MSFEKTTLRVSGNQAWTSGRHFLDKGWMHFIYFSLLKVGHMAQFILVFLVSGENKAPREGDYPYLSQEGMNF